MFLSSPNGLSLSGRKSLLRLRVVSLSIWRTRRAAEIAFTKDVTGSERVADRAW